MSRRSLRHADRPATLYPVIRTAEGRAVLLWVVVVASPLASGTVHAGPPNATPVPVPVLPVPVPVPAPSYCWLDIRLFETLRFGPVDFCRRNLRYRPGALECYQFTDQVCATFVPASGWVTARNAVDTQVFRCPDGPEPPVCRRLDLPALP
jgi:hypothetical protein